MLKNRKSQMDALGALLFILACIIAGWLFFRLVDPSKGGAVIRAEAARLGDPIDMVNLLDMPIASDISDLIVIAHMDGDWDKVELRLSDNLGKIFEGEIEWQLEVDDDSVISTAIFLFRRDRIFESDVWLPLPYNPNKKMINVKLTVYKR